MWKSCWELHSLEQALSLNHSLCVSQLHFTRVTCTQWVREPPLESYILPQFICFSLWRQQNFSLFDAISGRFYVAGNDFLFFSFLLFFLTLAFHRNMHCPKCISFTESVFQRCGLCFFFHLVPCTATNRLPEWAAHIIMCVLFHSPALIHQQISLSLLCGRKPWLFSCCSCPHQSTVQIQTLRWHNWVNTRVD